MSTFEDENNFKIFIPNTSRTISKESKHFLHAFSTKQEKVEKFYKDLKPTPLVKVARSEEIFGIGNLLIKDEGQRLGLKAFKVFCLRLIRLHKFLMFFFPERLPLYVESHTPA